MRNFDTRREHYPAEALKRAAELDREAVLELAARIRIEYARLMLEVTPKTTGTAVVREVHASND